MRYFFACLLLAASSVFAQPVQVQQNADCIIAFNIAASGGTIPSTGGFSNRQIGCNSWQISYANNGFSAISLAVQSAPDSSGSPGTWGTMGGTLTFGVNPNTNTSGASSLIQAYGTNFAPWVRVALTSATGSGNVIGVLLGYRAAGTAGTASSGVAVNATIVAPLGQTSSAASIPIVQANDQISGCARATPVNLSGGGNTQLITGVAAQNIYICDLEFATGTAEDVKLTEGTAANCGTGTADVTGLMKNITAWSLTPGSGIMANRATATAGDGLCINQSAAQAAGVTIWYIQR